MSCRLNSLMGLCRGLYRGHFKKSLRGMLGGGDYSLYWDVFEVQVDRKWVQVQEII